MGQSAPPPARGERRPKVGRARWAWLRWLPRRWRLPLRRAFVWLRYFYPYVWAHAPLCERYASESLRLGHIFVCRSCASAAAGAVVALSLGIGWGVGLDRALALALILASAIGVVAAAAFHNGRVRSRRGRDLSRAGLGLFTGIILVGPVSLGWLGLVVWPVLWLAAAIGRRRRPLGHVDRCAGCPHLGGQRACPGFSRQVQAVLRIQREL